ncbi:importin family nuclear export receptor Crm1 [Carpediemonas membranifera]|uniref:Importin family nuclear export receptor Crm1 n=1 Tax=Carpediemonas membranifera TaxID=201153 RepID=A0A8J6B472_9EUKA|nr:importin family nuclear export receptor Crm1 [Carpediemonas membranifera]|eukprot:KAG9393964.1 importin family nuclear export receptor Crm1 [Carpediemonas membranifera]
MELSQAENNQVSEVMTFFANCDVSDGTGRQNWASLFEQVSLAANGLPSTVDFSFSVAHVVLNRIHSDARSWMFVPAVFEHCTQSHAFFNALSIFDAVITQQWSGLSNDDKAQVRSYALQLIGDTMELWPRRTEPMTKMILNKLDKLLVDIMGQDTDAETPLIATFLDPSNLVLAQDAQTMPEADPTKWVFSVRVMSFISQLLDLAFDTRSKIIRREQAEWIKGVIASNSQTFGFAILAGSFRPEFAPTAFRLLGSIAIIDTDLALNQLFVQRIVAVLRDPNNFAAARNDVIKSVTIMFEKCRTTIRQDGYVQTALGLMWLGEELFRAILEGSTPDEEEVHAFIYFFCAAATAYPDIVERNLDSPVEWSGNQATVSDVWTAMLRHIIVFTDPATEADEVLFKMTVDFWQTFVHGVQGSIGATPGYAPGSPHALKTLYDIQGQGESSILAHLRRILVRNMRKPREVIVTQDDTGAIVREEMPDVESVSLHESMRAALIDLCRIDTGATTSVILDHLNDLKNRGHIVNGAPQFTMDEVNAVSWAAGVLGNRAFNGGRQVGERDFVLKVLTVLLGLVNRPGMRSEYKAVLAADIMYVCSQYPTFLRSHWSFLKTVTNKLFYFMSERHDGVPEMACDTFLTIADNCAREFVIEHHDPKTREVEPPFVTHVLAARMKSYNIDPDRNKCNMVNCLQSQHIPTFFRAVGKILAALPIVSPDNPGAYPRVDAIAEVLQGCNDTWAGADTLHKMIAQHGPGLQEMNEHKPLINSLINVLKANVAVAETIRGGFQPQMEFICRALIGGGQDGGLFGDFSRIIVSGIAAHGPGAVDHDIARKMRAFKEAALRVLTAFVRSAHADEKPFIQTQLLAHLWSIFSAYIDAPVPAAREASCLALLGATAECLGEAVQHNLAACLFGQADNAGTIGMVQSTLMMFLVAADQSVASLTAPQLAQAIAAGQVGEDTWWVDFNADPRLTAFPEALVQLIRDVTTYCPGAVTVSSAIRPDGHFFTVATLTQCAIHGTPAITEVAIKSLALLVERVSNQAPQFKVQWLQSYFAMVLKTTLQVLTDLQHQNNEVECIDLLRTLCARVHADADYHQALTDPASGMQGPVFIQAFMTAGLSGWFDNLTQQTHGRFVHSVVPDASQAFPSDTDFRSSVIDYLVNLRKVEGGQ